MAPSSNWLGNETFNLVTRSSNLPGVTKIFLDSSAVERVTVNHDVVGSIPTPGAMLE